MEEASAIKVDIDSHYPYEIDENLIFRLDTKQASLSHMIFFNLDSKHLRQN